MPVTLLLLVGATTLVDGLLAGASPDQSFWYAALGIGGALLTIAAAATAVAAALPIAQALPLVVAAGLAMAHSFTTARAAPINFSQRAAANKEAALNDIFARFERWQTARAALQLGTFLALVWALTATAAVSI